MILNKFDDITDAVKSVYEKLNYKNVACIDKSNEIRRNRTLVHNFDDNTDQIMLHALNTYDNLNGFVVFGKNKSSAYKYYQAELSTEYSIYGIKYLEIKATNMIKILYQLLFPRVIIKNKAHFMDFLREQYNFIWKYITNEKAGLYDMDVTVLILCKRDIKKKYPTRDIVTDNYAVFIPNTKDEIRHMAGVFFCSGTMHFTEIQNFDFFLTKENTESKNMFLKFRNWLFQNVAIDLQSQFMLYSSVVLYLIGHRSMNDLDVYSHTIPEELQSKIEELLKECESCDLGDFLDISIKNPTDPNRWPHYWDIWLDKWAQKCGAKYFEEILANPRYHFYFLGVKVISLECDVIRRLERGRPRAYADLISLRKRYGYRISIPEVPDTTTTFYELTKITEDEKADYMAKGGIVSQSGNEIQLKLATDVDKFINTIIYSLQMRYRMKFTENEIRKELNMRIINKIEPMADVSSNSKKIKIHVKKASSKTGI